MKKIPYGISDYRKIIENDYYYVDKTMYIEKLENVSETSIMFLRPRKFGKTLFTSMLECYYDINEKSKFDELFSETYIGKNPTKLKNSYHVLRFNFSGIDTSTEESTINGFKYKVVIAIERFVAKYNLDFSINENQPAENILYDLLNSFYIQKNSEKIYILIDEYDHFANELLGFQTNKFKSLVSKNGKVRKWYEILKEGTESVVDRIFITGIAPITLDSLTSGFNICTDETKDRSFNEMLGFTTEELIKIMDEQNISGEVQKQLLPLMKESYDGYRFSNKNVKNMYNSNMCLYFLNQYLKYMEIPDSLIDVNIASDYSKLSNMLDLCNSQSTKNILEKVISGEGVISEIIEKFNPEKSFGDEEFISILFYLGYLTINGEKLGRAQLKIPNMVMKEIYSSYFVQKINEQAELKIDER